MGKVEEINQGTNSKFCLLTVRPITIAILASSFVGFLQHFSSFLEPDVFSFGTLKFYIYIHVHISKFFQFDEKLSEKWKFLRIVLLLFNNPSLGFLNSYPYYIFGSGVAPSFQAQKLTDSNKNICK